MDRNQEEFAATEAHTRLDTLATSSVLAVMLVSILCGAFIVDVEVSQQSVHPAHIASVAVLG
jgi:hypothetical protein